MIAENMEIAFNRGLRGMPLTLTIGLLVRTGL